MHSKLNSLWTDEQLVDLMKQNDEIAFKHIYQKYGSKIYISSYNVIRNRVICEEIVQELFIHLWMNRHSLNITKLNSYLYKSARNRVLMTLRNKKVMLDDRVLEFLEANYSTDSLVREKELRKEIDDAIKELPEKCQQVFILSRMQQLSNSEIADILNISIKTVENHITKAIQKLRISLRYFLFIIALYPELIHYFF